MYWFLKDLYLEKFFISPSVVCFVKCVEQNHRRFSLKVEETVRFSYDKTITDKVTGKSYKVWVDEGYIEMLTQTASTDFLTDRELAYAYRRISKVYKDRYNKLWKLKTKRVKRQIEKEYGETK